jgi:hypothetical protein
MGPTGDKSETQTPVASAKSLLSVWEIKNLTQQVHRNSPNHSLPASRAHKPYPVQLVHLGLALHVGFIVCKHFEPETETGDWARAPSDSRQEALPRAVCVVPGVSPSATTGAAHLTLPLMCPLSFVGARLSQIHVATGFLCEQHLCPGNAVLGKKALFQAQYSFKETGVYSANAMGS